MENRLPKLRTLSEAYKCIKEMDPDTAVSANYVRCLAISGKVPRIKCGRKYLIDVDVLLDYLSAESSETTQEKELANTHAASEYTTD